jgi:hypothetical protein
MLDFTTTYVRTPLLLWLIYRGDASQRLLMKRIGWRADGLGIYIFERIAFKEISYN